MDQIPQWWHLVFCGWEAGRGSIALRGNKEHPKLEQNSSAALGFPLNICILQGSSKQHEMAWTKWQLPGQTFCCQGTRTSSAPHPQGHSQGAGICWLILDSWCWRSVVKLAVSSQITFSCMAGPDLVGGKTVWKNLLHLKWGCWQAQALQCWEQQQEVWLHVKTSRFETLFTLRDYTNNTPVTMELFTQLTVWRKHLLLSTYGG